MTNAMQKTEKFYNEQIKNQGTFQIGDIVADINAPTKRSFPMLVVYIANNPNDADPIRVVFFDEDEDMMTRWYAPYQLTLLKRLAE